MVYLIIKFHQFHYFHQILHYFPKLNKLTYISAYLITLLVLFGGDNGGNLSKAMRPFRVLK